MSNSNSKSEIQRRKKKTIEYGRFGYFFIAPFFIVYLIFSLWPLLYTLGLSFYEYYASNGGASYVGPNFIGLKNYMSEIKLFITDFSKILGNIAGSPQSIGNAFYNTFYIWFFNFVPQILLSLLLASWFTDIRIKLKGQGGFKVMMYMPNIITAATIAALFYSLFAVGGPGDQFLVGLGLKEKTFDLLNDTGFRRLLIAFIQFWMWYGNTMIILIAGVLGISPSLFEAAMVDGATSKQIYRNVTLPLLKPILLYTLVTSAIGGMQMFDIPKLMIKKAADYKTETISMYIFKHGISTRNLGKGATASVLLFVVTLILSLILFYIMRDKDEIKERKENKKYMKKIGKE
ncbi:carbohydrate ABC transporter membrane protein 1 (CUT1 family) [Mobilisporobacter senegalensis]|uniref:Carbohydrate ABC transporter membrane protein 1 (CUT1 family) n=1 Tax=Mobilisporobacter senegalensis TaxID=1329262 RepID=A0A3N1XWJ1_9FIRM|nr:sugar ABC transporter permease [Mobilisporobacter senegalensis]ROR29307.1 carbohydrate ABC transporter membrane protein 1 (CUT1 family) [Mobilisporobacter senegalensis]